MTTFFKKLRRGSKSLEITSPHEDASSGAVSSSEIKHISNPSGFKHEWHVGFNAGNGQFEGLPPAWDMWLKNSNIR